MFCSTKARCTPTAYLYPLPCSPTLYACTQPFDRAGKAVHARAAQYSIYYRHHPADQRDTPPSKWGYPPSAVAKNEVFGPRRLWFTDSRL